MLDALGIILCCVVGQTAAAAEPAVDVVVYGGSSAGVVAAVQAARMGRSVVLIEPGRHLGGLTSSGLGATDAGDKRAIGGVAREFYRRILRHYCDPTAWTRETLVQYRQRAPHMVDDECMWAFEPHAAERVLGEMLAEAGVPVVLGQRLDLKQGVVKQGTRIVAVVMESGRVFAGRVFIDATYEGDLMATAGVSYTVGREANSQYRETLNGVQTRNAKKHQFDKPVDPYVEPGNPTSGLLPGIHGGPAGDEGAGDHRIQAYNFRMCLTDVPENRSPFSKPANYHPLRYELLLRYLETDGAGFPADNTAMPNRKTDTNNNGPFSTDNIGANYDYSDGDYAAREKIIADHRDYQLGLMWTLVNDPRVPANLRQQANRWGLAKDEFADNANWPRQIYVREARRMIGCLVMTELHCRGKQVVEDSIGLASYTMDSHNVQRYVDAKGHARNEGDVQVGGFPPYPISYRSIIPEQTQCPNLLVPVCLSASHIAYASIRMEPVFMVLGQSAATAAVQAIEENCPVQSIDYARLRNRLLRGQQVVGGP